MKKTSYLFYTILFININIISFICICLILIKNKKMRIWSNGKISLCQGEDAGSIPAIRPG